MAPVSHIFGSEAKVKIVRLFVFNPSASFTPTEVANRAKERPESARRELRNLSKAGLVKRRGGKYMLDSAYPHLVPLENFLIDAAPLAEKDLIKKIAVTGNIKLILIAGVFLHEKDSRVDILVVGDHLKQTKLRLAVSSIEAELGKELRYAAFETADFRYRMSIYDKLIRDILESRHSKILNKLGL